jgi:tripartite-type tricarboxylate transporter receptor subunit TctC
MRRPALLPNVPTLHEAGLANFDASSWHTLFAPAHTPHDLITRLNTEVRGTLKRPDVAERLAALGVEAVGSTPEELADFLKSEIARWAEVVRRSGAKSD